MKEETTKYEKMIVDYTNGNLSETEEKELLTWLQSDKNQQLNYRKLLKERALSFIPIIENEKGENYKRLRQVLKIEEKPTIKRQYVLFKQLSKVAAILILVISLATAYYIYNKEEAIINWQSSFETVAPSGSRTQIVLPDKTIAWLNSGSVLKYKKSFGEKTRDVYLTGEGYFEVTKDKAKPFRVHTNELRVDVLGTKFNVRSHDEDNFIEVTLVEGKVNVRQRNIEESKVISLEPNKQLLYNKSTQESYVQDTDAHKYVQWTTGKLYFLNSSLVTIIKELERAYDVEIDIQSEDMRNEYFTGSLNLNLSLKEILNHIDVDKKYSWTQQDKTITFKSNK